MIAIFHFFQFEHELFWRYFKRLNVFLDRSGYCAGNWKILDIVDECVNSITHSFLEY